PLTPTIMKLTAQKALPHPANFMINPTGEDLGADLGTKRPLEGRFRTKIHKGGAPTPHTAPDRVDHEVGGGFRDPQRRQPS
ncbi:hypothetical protein, partial [Micromonospora sp. BL1]|uniref:hypothetical protein n=1 Tax=Micromonospora sp. BL1 TaxID=2478709 RepID=UPI001F3F0C6C